MDASWLMICSFVHLCSVCWRIFSENIISQKLLETVSAFCSSRLRHFIPAVQLCFLQRLVQELAEQLDNRWESWQVPFFEAYVPPSDSQLLRFVVSARFKSLNHDVWTVAFKNNLKCKVFNAWTNASGKSVEPKHLISESLLSLGAGLKTRSLAVSC